MRIYQLLMLLLLAVIALSSVVQACGDCHDEEKKKETAPAEKKKEGEAVMAEDKKKKEEEMKKKKAPEGRVEAVSPAPKKKKEEKKKAPDSRVEAVSPSPVEKKKEKKAPAPAPESVVMPLSPEVSPEVAPSPGSGVMAVSPSPAAAVSPANPLAVDVREVPEGTVIEQCLNGFGGFKARFLGPPPRIIDCICCQNANNIGSNFDASCGQITTFDFVTLPFDFCANCQDVQGCEKCFISSDPTIENAECKTADIGTGPGQVQPTPETILVNDIGGGPDLPATL